MVAARQPFHFRITGGVRVKDFDESSDWVKEKEIFLDGKGVWPKEILIKQDDMILRYRLIRTRSGKFQLVK